MFADSLPDGWGRLLVDRMLKNNEISPFEVDSLNKLAIVGDSGMGALTYVPVHEFEIEENELNLDKLALACKEVLITDNSEDLDELYKLEGGRKMSERLEDFLLFLDFAGISPENAVTDGQRAIEYFYTTRERTIQSPRGGWRKRLYKYPKIKLTDFMNEKKLVDIILKDKIKDIQSNTEININWWDNGCGRKFYIDCPEFSCEVRTTGNTKVKKGWYRSLEIIEPDFTNDHFKIKEFNVYVANVKFKNLTREEHTNAVLKFTFKKHRVGFWKDREKMLP